MCALAACVWNKDDNNAVELESERVVGFGGAAAEGVESDGGGRTAGVDESRREEIEAFLRKRFKKSQDTGVKVRRSTMIEVHPHIFWGSSLEELHISTQKKVT